jgi:hypothetical protein
VKPIGAIVAASCLTVTVASAAYGQLPASLLGKCFRLVFSGGGADSAKVVAAGGPFEPYLPAAISFPEKPNAAMRWVPITTRDAQALWRMNRGEARIPHFSADAPDTTRIESPSNWSIPSGWTVYLVVHDSHESWSGIQWVGSDYATPIHYQVALKAMSCDEFDRRFRALSN